MASRGKKVGEGEKLDAKTINKVGREVAWAGGGGRGVEPPWHPFTQLLLRRNADFEKGSRMPLSPASYSSPRLPRLSPLPPLQEVLTEQLKQQQELQRKLAKLGKQMDHLERARREEEAPLLLQAHEAKVKVRWQIKRQQAGSVVELLQPVGTGHNMLNCACGSSSLAAAIRSLAADPPVFCRSSCVGAVQEGEELFKSEAEAAKLAHRAAWEHDLSEKARVAKMQADREALAQQIQARRAEEFAALKVGQE
jgi:hypothetical protein